MAAIAFSATAVGAADETVVIGDAMEPSHLVIQAGDTVTWTNRDAERHRVRSREGPVEFDSGNLDTGQSFSFTFSAEGSYPYHDDRDREDADYHGTIVVGGLPVDPDTPAPDNGSVSIIDRSFRPADLTIAAGGTIEWANDDGEAHTVTSSQGTFQSGILAAGATFSQTFEQAGSYPYFCAIHPEMRGTINVADEPGPATEPAADPSVAAGASAPPGSPEPLVDPAAMASAAVTPAAETGVSIVDLSFQPATMEVSLGEAVTWNNDDDVGHTVTARDGAFNSGVLAVGDAFSTTFEAPGRYDYFCAIHPEMTASVVVSGSAASADPVPVAPASGAPPG